MIEKTSGNFICIFPTVTTLQPSKYPTLLPDGVLSRTEKDQAERNRRNSSCVDTAHRLFCSKAFQSEVV